MLKIEREVKEVENNCVGQIPAEVFESAEPLILRGLVRDWPLTKLGLESFDEASNYILKFYQVLFLVIQKYYYYSEYLDCSSGI